MHKVVATRRSVKVWLMALVLAVAVPLGVVWSQDYEAPTGDLATQLATAIQHAGFSATAGEHAMAARHLGHVLNCIAGEGGDGFNAEWGHPCNGQGAGIANDLASHPAAADLAIVVEAARQLAMQGVADGSLGSVQAAANGVRALLSVFAP
ncbi:MAG: hypothetical protein KF813_05850 [Trueperaceae bacterium]|nr:hypothetical protein [Trueperaceae bacterium]